MAGARKGRHVAVGGDVAREDAAVGVETSGTLLVRADRTDRLVDDLARFLERNRVLDRTHGLGHGASVSAYGYGLRLTAYGLASRPAARDVRARGSTSFVIASRTAPSEPGNATMIFAAGDAGARRGSCIAAGPISS